GRDDAQRQANVHLIDETQAFLHRFTVVDGYLPAQHVGPLAELDRHLQRELGFVHLLARFGQGDSLALGLPVDGNGARLLNL
ncbi:MAG: hypothetical protein HC828_16080, partial [Blastochloris sp.]|nr:hypothetical protein [Blastochloris sp.]